VRFEDFKPATASTQPSGQSLPDAVIESPWHRAEYPRVSRWLERNEAAMQRFRKACRRPKWYFPLWSNAKPEVMATDLPHLQHCRGMSNAIAADAWADLAAGSVETAKNHAVALIRLGRRIGQQGPLISRLVGVSIERLGHQLVIDLARSPQLSAAEAKAMQQRLESLPPHPPMAKALGVGERVVSLDAVVHLWRSSRYQKQSTGVGLGNQKQLPQYVGDAFNPNTVLRDINKAFDRTVAIAELKEYTAFKKQAEQWERRLDEKIDIGGFEGVAYAAGAYLAPGRLRRVMASEMFSRMLLGMVMPAVTTAAETQWHLRMKGRLSRLALALAAYRNEHGQYPTKLKALTPDWLDQVPQDVFTQKPLHYQRQGPEEVLVYSVGPNLADDGGEHNDGWNASEDDVTLRMKPFKSSATQPGDDVPR
jgi:hypothetical protein